MGNKDVNSNAAVFEDLALEDIKALLTHGRVQTCELGHLLFERGHDAHDLILLDEGTVELFVPVDIMGATRKLTLETKEAGEVVAWSALVSPHHFTVSARCTSRCVVTCLGRADLFRFFDDNPRCGYLFMRNLGGVVGRRLHNLQGIWIHDLQLTATKQLES